ncbi:MAG: CpsD/CapB family tyrosine-protein kinase [Firmicutes bacterium]|nr:CpsD/CapB family tyrosine-protein kinase [Bacillota bacterium]
MLGLFNNKRAKRNAEKDLKDRTTILKVGNFAVTEAYNQLRTNILFAVSAQDSNIIEFSSSFSGEGKSITSANTAITIAQANAKVLLIDCDLRKPVQHKIFGLKNDKGVSTLIGRMSKAEDTIHKGVIENLDVLTSGPIPPNPSEMIVSKRMQELFEEFSQKYDYIIVDTPPINVVTDALELTKYTSGLVLVVRQGITTYEDIKKSLSSANLIDANIIGVVLNDVRDLKQKYGRYNKYGYYKSYGYESKDEKKLTDVKRKK